MPFVSKYQERAAFSGALGPKMKAKAPQWADETPNQKALPMHVKNKRRTLKDLGTGRA